MITRATTRLKAAAAGLERHTLGLGLLLVPVLAFLVYVSAASVNGVPFRDGYVFRVALPDDVPPLKASDAVRVGGQRVGSVQDVELTPTGGVLEIELDSAHAPVGRDAELFVRLRSASYLYYVDLDPGDRDDALPEGDMLPAAQVDFGTDPLEVARSFGEDTQRAFKGTVTALGFGVAGRGGDLNLAFGDLATALRDGTPQLEALTPPGSDTGELVEGARRTVRGLAGARADDIEATIPAVRATLETLAGRERELGMTIEQVPPLAGELRATLPLADPLLGEGAVAARRLTPLVRELDAVLPEVRRLLATGSTLRSEAMLLGEQLDPVLERAAPVLRALYPAAAALEPALRPLRGVVAQLARYDEEITVGTRRVLGTTQNNYPEGNPPDNPALRFAPILTCHSDRNPYPEPGEALADRSSRDPNGCR